MVLRHLSNPVFVNHMENCCIVCETTLNGRQRKYCSANCKFTFTNNKHQNYVSQQRRGYDRKAELIRSKGGKCEVCGNNKNRAALCFHHTKPHAKTFQIDIRKCSNSSWDRLVDEANKCMLLCLNCHAELHNPSFST
jgi:hypothetical protein